MTEKTQTEKAQSKVPGTVSLETEEGAALVSACLVILFDLLKGGDRLPDAARPLFRAYMKLCGASNHQIDPSILQAAMQTWDRHSSNELRDQSSHGQN